MSLSKPPIQHPIAGPNGVVPQVWVQWFLSLVQSNPVSVPSYTVAGLPSASSYVSSIVFVSDESGGAVLAFSDGATWRRVTDRAICS
jgi:hypothetical protein